MVEYKGDVVIIGAGRSGRGLHGEFCFKDGWRITFADIDRELIRKMRAQGSYTSFSEKDGAEGFEECVVSGYRALHIVDDRPEYIDALAYADIIFTATFDDAFESIVCDIKDALDRKIELGLEKQFALVVGANYVGLYDYFSAAFARELDSDERRWFDRFGVLAESIIYRVSSFPNEEQKARDELSVQNDSFAVLQVNTGQFARADKIEKPGFFQDEDDTLRFMHCKIWNINTAHCSLAFLGQYYGCACICDAANDDYISRVSYLSSVEAYAGLAKRYDLPDEPDRESERALWGWYRDRTMLDTVERVGNDPIRKLRRNDRFIGPALNCMKYDILPVHICQNAAYGFFFHNEGDARTDRMAARIASEGIEQTIQQVCGLDIEKSDERVVFELILSKYRDLADVNPLDKLLA